MEKKNRFFLDKELGKAREEGAEAPLTLGEADILRKNNQRLTYSTRMNKSRKDG